MPVNKKKTPILPTFQPILGPSLEGFADNSKSIGVLRVVVQSAEIYRRSFFFCTPNPFVRIRMPGREDVGCTNWRPKTFSPNWRFQSHFVLVNSSDEHVELDVLSYHSFRPPTLIGSTIFPLTLDKEANQWSAEAKLIKQHYLDVKGSLLFNAFYYPELESSSVQTGPGIVRFILHEVRNLQYSKPLIAALSLGWNELPLHITKPTTNSVWNSVFDFLCPDRKTAFIVVKLIKAGLRTSVLAHVSVSLQDLLQDERDEKWLSLSGQTEGQLRIFVNWKPVRIPKTDR